MRSAKHFHAAQVNSGSLTPTTAHRCIITYNIVSVQGAVLGARDAALGLVAPIAEISRRRSRSNSMDSSSSASSGLAVHNADGDAARKLCNGSVQETKQPLRQPLRQPPKAAHPQVQPLCFPCNKCAVVLSLMFSSFLSHLSSSAGLFRKTRPVFRYHPALKNVTWKALLMLDFIKAYV